MTNTKRARQNLPCPFYLFISLSKPANSAVNLSPNSLCGLRSNLLIYRVTYNRALYNNNLQMNPIVKSWSDLSIGPQTFHWVALLLGLCLLVHVRVASAAEITRPNVIFIMSDDQGSADAGCYGATDIQTPALDALAESGVRFAQFSGSSLSGVESRQREVELACHQINDSFQVTRGTITMRLGLGSLDETIDAFQ